MIIFLLLKNYIIYNNPNDINYLTELKLDFHKIKQLKLKYKENLKELSEEKKGDTDNNNKILEKITYDTFYKTLFALPDIQNVLIDLNLKISEKKGYNENISIPSSFEEINNLKALQNLSINGYNFANPFTLKLFNLKKLELWKVKNIEFDKNNSYNLNYLCIYDSKSNNIKILNF